MTVGGSQSQAALAALPPEVWPLVLECLTFESIQACALTSKSILSGLTDGLPLVRSLYIDHPSQLRPPGRILELLSGVRDMCISFENEGSNEVTEDDITTATALPFFLRNFSRLETVSFGYYYNGFVLGIFPSLPRSENMNRCLTRLLEVFSGAFHAGALPNTLSVRGLYCPPSDSGRVSPGCQTCRRMVKNFPFSHAPGFQYCLPFDVMKDVDVMIVTCTSSRHQNHGSNTTTLIPGYPVITNGTAMQLGSTWWHSRCGRRFNSAQQ